MPPVHIGLSGSFWPRHFSPFLRYSMEILSLRSEEHTSELQSRLHLVCRLLLEKKKKNFRLGSRAGVHFPGSGPLHKTALSGMTAPNRGRLAELTSGANAQDYPAAARRWSDIQS